MLKWSALLNAIIGCVMLVAGIILIGLPFTGGNAKYVFTEKKLQKVCKAKGKTVTRSDKDKFKLMDYKDCSLEFITPSKGNGKVTHDEAMNFLKPFKQDGMVVEIIAYILIAIGAIWAVARVLGFFLSKKYVATASSTKHG